MKPFAIDNFIIEGNNSVSSTVEISVDPSVSLRVTHQGELAGWSSRVNKLKQLEAMSEHSSQYELKMFPIRYSLSTGTKLPNGDHGSLRHRN